jgi:D-sedoheptulose 7-phosphate isomerase
MEHRTKFAEAYVAELERVLRETPWDRLSAILAVLERAHSEDRQVFLAGNGGSAATATHMGCDLMLTVQKNGGRGFRVVALADNVAALTAAANDDGYANVFVSQLRALARRGDVLLVISGSGNSENVVRAAEFARAHGMQVVGLLGMGGGKLASLCDAHITVASDDYGQIEDVHMVIDHLMTAYLRKWLSEGRGDE